MTILSFHGKNLFLRSKRLKISKLLKSTILGDKLTCTTAVIGLNPEIKFDKSGYYRTGFRAPKN